jgi:polyhydroxyalkanoate synthase
LILPLLAHADLARRAAGAWLDAAGLGPVTTPSRVVHDGRAFDVLAYADRLAPGPVTLLVPAPLKRAYIWDLAPAVSVVRRCLERGLRVHLLRWREPTGAAEWGLADYADRFLAEALAAVETDTAERRAVLIGHSLGGTLAALAASLHPERVRALVLLEAPLAFGGRAAGALGALVPAAALGSARAVVPGTLLDLAAVAAAPEAFVWARWLDRLRSLGSLDAALGHLRVERWALDELPLPGRLLDDITEWLYRRDAFARGTLRLGGRGVDPRRLTALVVAVVDPRSRLVPPAAVRPVLDVIAGPRVVLEYPGDVGVALQHVGVLVGATAHRELWPRILDHVLREAA